MTAAMSFKRLADMLAGEELANYKRLVAAN